MTLVQRLRETTMSSEHPTPPCGELHAGTAGFSLPLGVQGALLQADSGQKGRMQAAETAQPDVQGDAS
jgi:hypothetical protein